MGAGTATDLSVYPARDVYFLCTLYLKQPDMVSNNSGFRGLRVRTFIDIAEHMRLSEFAGKLSKEQMMFIFPWLRPDDASTLAPLPSLEESLRDYERLIKND